MKVQRSSLYSFSRVALASHCLFAVAIDIRDEKTLRAAVRRKPKDAQSHLALAEWYLGWQDVPQAVETLRNASIADPQYAWHYNEYLGDILYEHRNDLGGSRLAYKEALDKSPKLDLLSNRTWMRYGNILIWNGARAEAEAVFANAAKSGLLQNPNQRPEVEFLPELQCEDGFWFQAASNPKLATVMKELTDIIPVARKEYEKWSKTRAKDAVVDTSVILDRNNSGRRLHFWIHRPQFERGTWRDSCSYKTPKTCEVLRRMNASGILVFQASFDVLEPGATVMSHCHHTNRELFLDAVLFTPQHGHATLTASGRTVARLDGDVNVFDGSFEHSEANRLPAAFSHSSSENRVLLRIVVRHPSAKWRPGDDEAWWQVRWRQLKARGRKFLIWGFGGSPSQGSRHEF